MNLFNLAEDQLIKEGKVPTELSIIEYAIKIRAWLDKHENIGNKILSNSVTKFDRYNWKKRYSIKI